MARFKHWLGSAGLAALLGAMPMVALAQDNPEGRESIGRGWPVSPDPNDFEYVGAQGGVGIFFQSSRYAPDPQIEIAAATNGAVPEGIAPLERDIFNSDDFYLDRELWSDPRYFRCNAGLPLENMWGGLADQYVLIGDTPPETGAWGHCDRDYPRESIVSPYGFSTAREHFEALRDEAAARGTLGTPSAEDLEEWHAYYVRRPLETWFYMRINQISTILSLLTPQYQQRAVQEFYHYVHNSAWNWPGTYCWPEGFMRRNALFGGESNIQIITTPNLVQFASAGVDNTIYQVHLDREFNLEGATPRLGEDVPRWLGESVGFWDGDALIFWTSNVQGWTSHGVIEFSNAIQSIEIVSPERNEDGQMTGLMHELIFYDAQAFVEPLRLYREYTRQREVTEGNPFVISQCLQSQFPVDGRPSLITAGESIEIVVPDYFNRPWAQIWERFFEDGMERPRENSDLFGF